ncbi:MAG: hypothetical protein EBR60_09525 [Burkholderiaceae bacterium]|nr:hypothetical protein [Burkholderiaceae bacterium]
MNQRDEWRLMLAAFAMNGLMSRFPDVLSLNQIRESSFEIADAMLEEDKGIAAIKHRKYKRRYDT